MAMARDHLFEGTTFFMKSPSFWPPSLAWLIVGQAARRADSDFRISRRLEIAPRAPCVFFAVARGSRSTPLMATPVDSGAGREVGLRGRLEQFGLATVLTFLDLERRSGELLLLG